MAIFHCHIKIGSRGAGRSAAAASAYRAGEKIEDREIGLTHDFTRKSGVVYSEVLLPKNAPEEFMNRETLWNSAQAAERQQNGQLFREIELALPVEMTRQQQIEAVWRYAQKNFVDEGMCVDWSLHDKGDGNPHAHLMLTMRELDDKGKWMPKRKTVYAHDEFGERIPIIDKKTGSQKIGKNGRHMWKREEVETNDWNKQYKAERWRENWAKMCNKCLDKDHQIDHRSFERRGIDRAPTIHEGYVSRQRERRGEVSERCQYNRDIRKLNTARHQLELDQRGVILDIAKERQDRALRRMWDEIEAIRNYGGGKYDFASKQDDKDRAGATRRSAKRRSTKNIVRRAYKSDARSAGRNPRRSFADIRRARDLSDMPFGGVDSKAARADLLLPDTQRSRVEVERSERVRDHGMQREGAATDRGIRDTQRQIDAIRRRKAAEKRAAEKAATKERGAKLDSGIKKTGDRIAEIKQQRATTQSKQALSWAISQIKSGVAVANDTVEKLLPDDAGKLFNAAVKNISDTLDTKNLNPVNAIKTGVTNSMNTITKLAECGNKDANAFLQMGKVEELGLPKDWLYMTEAEKDALLTKRALVDDYGLDEGKSLMSGYKPPAQQQENGFARVFER